jgi:hypothetical protein
MTLTYMLRFATNTTKESPQRLRHKLDALGFEIQENEVRMLWYSSATQKAKCIHSTATPDIHILVGLSRPGDFTQTEAYASDGGCCIGGF